MSIKSVLFTAAIAAAVVVIIGNVGVLNKAALTPRV
jgi:hypothetical protein